MDGEPFGMSAGSKQFKRSVSRLHLEHKRTDTSLSVPSGMARKIISALKDENKHGTARTLTERIGEIRNLPGDDQERSICAILIKKYRFSSQPLANLYSSLKKRPLSAEDCASVRRIVDSMNAQDKQASLDEWIRISSGGVSEWKPRFHSDDEEGHES